LDRIVLGSGTLYALLYSGTIPADAALEVDANKLGDIKGGATLEYTPTFYEAMDDSGARTKRILTDEVVLLKSGIMTWNGVTLKKLCQTARVTESGGKRTVKIGGIGNASGEKYLLRFVHEDPEDGDIRLTIVGGNQAGMSLAFTKGAETVINAEFKAFPQDSDGTLVTFVEEIRPEQALTVTSVAASVSGETTLTVTPAAGAGNSFKYRAGLYIEAPRPGDSAAAYSAFTSGSDYEIPSGYTVIVVEVDGTGTIVKYGSVTAVSND
jgi:hypothetical protein